MNLEVLPGLPYPLGSTVDKNGVNAEFTVTGRSNDLDRYNTAVALGEEAKKLKALF